MTTDLHIFFVCFDSLPVLHFVEGQHIRSCRRIEILNYKRDLIFIAINSGY